MDYWRAERRGVFIHESVTISGWPEGILVVYVEAHSRFLMEIEVLSRSSIELEDLSISSMELEPFQGFLGDRSLFKTFLLFRVCHLQVFPFEVLWMESLKSLLSLQRFSSPSKVF